MEEQIAIDWAAYAAGVEKQIAEIRKDLEPLETGRMTLGEREVSGPWRDVTHEMIERHYRNIATYEAILKDIRERRIT